MACPPVTVAAAVDALRAAGHVVTRTTGADAARRYGCQTLRYVVDGRAVNVGRLRQLALAAADAAPVPAPADQAIAHLCRKFPVSTPATWQPAVDRLAARRVPVTVGGILRETERPALIAVPVAPGVAAARAARAARVTLPGGLDRVTPPHRFGGASEPTPALATLRADAAAGRPVSLAALARAVAPVPAPATPRGDALAGQPWDPGTADARARVALQGERVATLWPIAQALRGEGVTLPGAWATDGPVMAGEWPYDRALAVLPAGAIAQAAAALAALPPVTTAQDRALTLCRSANRHTRPGLYHTPAA
jgi:hypothetical protein